MTRTSLFTLASRADLWPVPVPGTKDIRIDDGDVIRYGSRAAPARVAECIIRRRRERDGESLRAVDIRRELLANGYRMPVLPRTAMKQQSKPQRPRAACAR